MLRDLGIDDRADERRIAVGVQQVERPIAVQFLFLVDEVERQVQERFDPSGTIMYDDAPLKCTPTFL